MIMFNMFSRGAVANNPKDKIDNSQRDKDPAHHFNVEIIEKLNADGIRNSVKVIIGGAPVTQNFANEIGADGYAADAASAVTLVKDILNITN